MSSSSRIFIPNRRGLLKAGAGLAAGGILAPWLSAEPRLQSGKVKRVILVAFAGGVRTRETLGAPDNVPNLVRMAQDGIAYTRVRTSNLGHFGATLSLFTGIAEARGIRENALGDDPTIFEYVRKDLGLAAGDVWVSTSGGAQQTNYACSLHKSYGQKYAANTLDGDGIFNAEFKGIVDGFGQPRRMPASEKALFERMRKSLGSEAQAPEGSESFARIERYLLDELGSGTSELRGTGSADAKALRVARNLMAVFKPTLLGVTLQSADVAHGSFNGYVEVIRRNDAMLGELWEAVRADPETRDSTAIFVLPEFGRDSDLNSRRGLDHGDGSDDLNYVSIVGWGAGIAKGRTVREDVRTIDVCASICGMLGANPRYAKGRKLPKLLG
jgi:hypothetical protein